MSENPERPTVGPKGGTGTPPKPTFDQLREELITKLQRENSILKDANIALANRVCAQSEILSKNADKKIDEHEGKKYVRSIIGATDSIRFVESDGKRIPVIEVDVYAVLLAFNVDSQPIGHAIKKLLAPGGRGKGNILDDLRGVIAAVSRAIDEEKIRQWELRHPTTRIEEGGTLCPPGSSEKKRGELSEDMKDVTKSPP